MQDKAAGGQLSSFSTHSSSTATDLAFDIGAFLSQNSRKGLPALLMVSISQSKVSLKGILFRGILLYGGQLLQHQLSTSFENSTQEKDFKAQTQCKENLSGKQIICLAKALPYILSDSISGADDGGSKLQ